MQQSGWNIRRTFDKSKHPTESLKGQDNLYRSRLLAREGEHLFHGRQEALCRLEKGSGEEQAED